MQLTSDAKEAKFLGTHLPWLYLCPTFLLPESILWKCRHQVGRRHQVDPLRRLCPPGWVELRRMAPGRGGNVTAGAPRLLHGHQVQVGVQVWMMVGMGGQQGNLLLLLLLLTVPTASTVEKEVSQGLHPANGALIPCCTFVPAASAAAAAVSAPPVPRPGPAAALALVSCKR